MDWPVIARAPSVSRWGGCLVAGWLTLAAPGVAQASNGATPRTPPVFQLEQCLSIVDRTAESTFVVEFSIPVEDDELTADELDDSRRFQFFAQCRDTHQLVETLPNWITVDDAQRSLDAGLIENLPADGDILESEPTWSGCMLAINGADSRIPITCEATEGGTTWDASRVEAGNYVLRGYTFEPALNRWAYRRGVVQVHDGEPLPVVSLMTPAVPDRQAFEGDGPLIEGCMGGPAGTTVTLQWARLIDLGEDEPSDWTTFAMLDATDGDFSVKFEPPAAAVNQAIVFRGEAVAPSGERWTGYAVGSVVVFPGDGTADGPGGPGGLDHCDFYPDDPDPTGGGTTGDGTTGDGGSSSGPGTTSAATEGETETTSAGQTPAEEDGCGCRIPRGRDRPWSVFLWGFALAAVFGPRRRHTTDRL
jgi:hypothetical protein